MFRILETRLQQKHRTIAYPKTIPELPDRFRGMPILVPSKCRTGCSECMNACPTGAITAGPTIDLGRCVFCGQCSRVCAEGAISFSQEHRLATGGRKELLCKNETAHLTEILHTKAKSLFGRSFKLRQVSAGGCNACEADTNVLSTVGWDLGRFGIQFVASPRHADGLLITGPVTNNMRLALEKTYDAVPAPKIVIALGACAISGGLYRDHPEVQNGADLVVPVDLYIPGCPPHPLTILDGMLRLLGKL